MPGRRPLSKSQSLEEEPPRRAPLRTQTSLPGPPAEGRAPRPGGAGQRQRREEAGPGRPRAVGDHGGDGVQRRRDQGPRGGDVQTLLTRTLKALKIRAADRSAAAQRINEIVKLIVQHLKKNSSFFNVQEPLNSGSYYENLKGRVHVTPFGDECAFYSVRLKRGEKALLKFQPEDGPLSASDMLKEFRGEVKKCVKSFTDVEVERKKPGCPAVTLQIQVGPSRVSLDVVMCLQVPLSWPAFTKDGLQIQKWLGNAAVKRYRSMPFYLVPKYKGNAVAECDGVFAKDVWRISFSHVEKDIMKNHGLEKTCCEGGRSSCCRKDCLKLLKHLLQLLKDGHPPFDKFCSYYAKTALLHACCSRPEDSAWQPSSLAHCFQQLLQDFEGHLRSHSLPNFFLPGQNLLSEVSKKSCASLAQRIQEERERGFPIFLPKED